VLLVTRLDNVTPRFLPGLNQKPSLANVLDGTTYQLLKGLGILELPGVGENLQDHVKFNIDYLLKEDLSY